MKKILSCLSVLFLFACGADPSTEHSDEIGNVTNKENHIDNILVLADLIQNSNEEYININKIRPTLEILNESNITTTDSSIFIVELNLSGQDIDDNSLINSLNIEYGIPLSDNELTSWYLSTSSGKELEISLLKKPKEETLRFLIRTYL